MLIYPEFDLLLVRHGQSTTNANPDLMGQLGSVPLSELGIKQAQALQKRLEKNNFDWVYSSDYERALETANIALPHFEKIIVPALREYNAGEWTSVSRSQSITDEIRLSMGYFGGSFRPPGEAGESLNMVQRRVTEWLDKEILYNEDLLYSSTIYKTKKNQSKPSVICFSHGMTIKTILQYIMGFDRNFMWKLNMDNTGICKLSFGKEGWKVDCINDTAHLQNLLK